jgi:death-on-curing protein
VNGLRYLTLSELLQLYEAVMENFLLLNGWEIVCGVDDQERVILQVASGKCSREALTQWLRGHVKPS